MGILSRSSNNQQTTNNTYNTDARSVDTTTNEGDFAGVTGDINITGDRAWDFGERAFETIKEITASGQDGFSQGLAKISEQNSSILGQVVEAQQSAGASSWARYLPWVAAVVLVGAMVRG